MTKSVMSMLVGIALEDGHLDSFDQTLGELLPSYADRTSAQTKAITLQQVLTMTAGLPTGADEEALAKRDWVAESTRPHVATTELGRAHYGYQWWVTEADGNPAFAAVGYDGQLIEIVPDLDLVVVVVSDEGTTNVQSDALLSIVAFVIAPALRTQPR